jgi:DNA-binding NtrC family response regulator
LYRLNGFTIQLPPLRERLDDIPILTEHFLKVFNRELNKNIVGVSTEVMHILQSHDWPGNVREFQSAIKYAMIHATGAALTPDCLPQSCHPSLTTSTPASHVAEVPIGPSDKPSSGVSFDLIRFVRQLLMDHKPDLYRVLSQEVDRQILQEVMAHCDGNQLQAAERLGISRMTLRSKLRSLGMIQEKGGE